MVQETENQKVNYSSSLAAINHGVYVFCCELLKRLYHGIYVQDGDERKPSEIDVIFSPTSDNERIKRLFDERAKNKKFTLPAAALIRQSGIEYYPNAHRMLQKIKLDTGEGRARYARYVYLSYQLKLYLEKFELVDRFIGEFETTLAVGSKLSKFDVPSIDGIESYFYLLFDQTPSINTDLSAQTFHKGTGSMIEMTIPFKAETVLISSLTDVAEKEIYTAVAKYLQQAPERELETNEEKATPQMIFDFEREKARKE